MILRLAILTQYQRVTDTQRQTHTQTHDNSICRANIMMCGKNRSTDVTTHLSGTVCHPQAGTCYDQPSLKVEVSMFSVFTHYKDMKSNTLGWFGG